MPIGIPASPPQPNMQGVHRDVLSACADCISNDSKALSKTSNVIAMWHFRCIPSRDCAEDRCFAISSMVTCSSDTNLGAMRNSTLDAHHDDNTVTKENSGNGVSFALSTTTTSLINSIRDR